MKHVLISGLMLAASVFSHPALAIVASTDYDSDQAAEVFVTLPEDIAVETVEDAMEDYDTINTVVEDVVVEDLVVEDSIDTGVIEDEPEADAAVDPIEDNDLEETVVTTPVVEDTSGTAAIEDATDGEAALDPWEDNAVEETVVTLPVGGDTTNDGAIQDAPGKGIADTDTVIDASEISDAVIGNGWTITAESALENPGIDLMAAITCGDAVMTDAALLVDENGTGKCINELVSEVLSAELSLGTATATGDGTGGITIFSDDLGDTIVTAGVVSVVTTDLSDTVELTSTGETFLVSGGIAMTLAPAAADPDEFATALSGLTDDNDIGEDGVVIAFLPDNTKLAMRFDTVAQKNAILQNDAASSPSISVEGDPLNPETLMVRVTYSDGTVQNLPPFIHHLPMFKQAMADAGFSIDPSSGMIQVSDDTGQAVWQGIPGYMLEAPPDNVIGMQFEPAGDLNGDGTDDIYVITYLGKQPVYAQ